MVAPVTDLGTTTLTRNEFDEYGHIYCHHWQQIHRYRQARPFTLVLPYFAVRQTVVARVRASSSAYTPADANDPLPTPFWSYDNVKNLSYERLRGKLYDRAGLGVTFAEYRQSAGMIASSAATLIKAVRQVKRLDFPGAAKTLRMKFLPKGVSPAKSLGNNWLEFHFGWRPLVKDIYDACEVINDPYKTFHLERSRVTEPQKSGSSWDYSSVVQTWDWTSTISCTQGARVKFSRPGTVHTLEQLGLTNPALLAWELVPFSFVVDWFVNVGDFLQSQTDFAGMDLESTFCTIYTNALLSERWVVKNPAFSYFNAYGKLHYRSVERLTSLSGVSLQVRSLKPPSLSRAATAISLLLQQLKR